MRCAPSLLICLFIIVSLLLGGCAVVRPAGAEAAAEALTLPQRQQLGRMLAAYLVQQQGGVLEDAELNAAVNDLGQRLLAASGRHEVACRFVVTNDSLPQAVTVPGVVLMSRGLLLRSPNAAAVAVRLSHELGHLLGRHPQQQLQRARLLATALELSGQPDDEGALAPVAALVDFYSRLEYRPSQELAADQLAGQLLVRAGFDPQVLLDVTASPGEDAPADPRRGYERMHPPSPRRHAALRERLAADLDHRRSSPALPQLEQALARVRQTAAGYRLHAQARELERHGELAAAISRYLAAATATPDQSLILTDLGLAYVQAGDLSSGSHYLTRAVQLDGGYYRSRLGLGYLLVERRQGAQAQPHLQRSQQLLPTLQGQYLLAEVALEQGDFAQARRRLETLVAIDGRGRWGRAAKQRLKALPQP